MSDKLKELADLIVTYSIHVEKDEKVLITTQSMETREFVSYLIEAIYKSGGVPSLKINCVIQYMLLRQILDYQKYFQSHKYY